MSESRIKAVIFDMGGVLLRTEDHNPRNTLARQFGISREELEHLVFISETSIAAETGAISREEHFQTVCRRLGIAPEDQLAFVKAFWAGDRIDVDLVDFIRSLRPRYKTALLSNAWDGTWEFVKEIYDFSDAFDAMVFSADVGMRKPEAEIFHYVVEKLGVRPDEALFVDDFAPNVEGARRAGLQAIQFITREQAERDVLAALGQPVM